MLEYSEVWHDIGVILLGQEDYNFSRSRSLRHPIITYKDKGFLVFGQYKENKQGVYFYVHMQEKLIGELRYINGKIEFMCQDTKEIRNFNLELLEDLRHKFFK